MKFKILLFLVVLGISLNLNGQNKFDQTELVGSWLGKLKVQGFELRLIFNLSENESGTLMATMDSPDQGAKGISMGDVSFDGENLKINAPAIRGYYLGEMQGVDSLKGTWHQNGQSFELALKKQAKAFTFNRPQEPKAPFPYLVEEVKFKNENAGHTLAGTLTLPKGEGEFPAVILISGSGAQNRNEEIFGHKPFMVIADYFAKQGIAVLRYDDQGVGQSGGSQLGTTTYNYSFDAEAALKFLRMDERINSKAIGFAGHSEGGLIASMVSSRIEGVAFLISLGGPALPGSEIILSQTKALAKAQGMPEDEISKQFEQNKTLFEILMNENNNEKAQELMLKSYALSLKESGKNETEIAEEVQAFKQNYPKVVYNWMRYYLKTDPADFLVKMKCPVLVLNGDKDLQVISKQNLNAYEQIFKKSGLKDYELIELKNHNHLFQHCKTGLPSEYGSIEESFSEEAMEMMANWIWKRFLKE